MKLLFTHNNTTGESRYVGGFTELRVLVSDTPEDEREAIEIAEAIVSLDRENVLRLVNGGGGFESQDSHARRWRVTRKGSIKEIKE